jgi:hypothetical protein
MAKEGLSYVPDSDRAVVLPSGLQVGRFDRYEGGVQNGAFHGAGELRVVGGWVFKGEFKDGYLHGRATVIAPDGSREECEWNRGFRAYKRERILEARRSQSQSQQSQQAPQPHVPSISVSSNGVSHSASVVLKEKCTRVTDSVSVCGFQRVRVSSATGPAVAYGASVKKDDKDVAAVWVGAGGQPAFKSKTAVVVGAGTSPMASEAAPPVGASRTVSSSSVHRVTTSVSTKGVAVEVSVDPAIISRRPARPAT